MIKNKWKYVAVAVLGFACIFQVESILANMAPQYRADSSPQLQVNTEGDQVSVEIWFTDKDNNPPDTLIITNTVLLPGLSATISGPQAYPRNNWWSVIISGTLPSNSATSVPFESSVTISDGTDSVGGSFSWTVIDGNPNPLADDAQIVYLRKDCTTQENCFVSLGSLEAWINNVRVPTPDLPLLVEVGPGQFAQDSAPHFNCKTGNITFRGSGRMNTIIGSSTITGNGLSPAMIVDAGQGCFNLVVEDLSLIGSDFGVYWAGIGSSIWRNVDSIGGVYGWSSLNPSCGDVPLSTHFWHTSRIIGRNSSTFAKGYSSSCDDNWFFGCEVTGEGANDEVLAIKAQGVAKFHIYGSNLNAIAAPGAAFSQPGGAVTALEGVVARDNSEVHIHGTGIDVIGEANGTYGITGIRAEDNARVHAQGTAYNLVPPAGQEMHRLVDTTGTGSISAPYQWKPSATPPVGLVSQEGADMFVESDCSTAGCLQTGAETHLLIYSSNCKMTAPQGGPWFDVVTAKCRGE